MKPDYRKLKPLIWIAMISFIAIYLLKNSYEILSYGYQFNWPYVLVSLIFVLLAYLLSIAIWIWIASHYGADASWLSHARIWSTSRLGRYIPGKIATIYLRIDGYETSRRSRAGVSLYIETASSLIAICFFILASSMLGFVVMSLMHLALIAATLVMLLLFSSSLFLRKIFSRFSSLKNLSPPKTRADNILLMKMVGLQTIVMLLHGVSLFLVIHAFTTINPGAIVEITVIYYFAGLIGMLALFAPAGIGVREALLVGLLQTLIQLPVAVVSVALIRLLTIAAELILSGTFTILTRREISSTKED